MNNNGTHDEALEKLEALINVLRENGQRIEQVIARAEVVKTQRLAGVPYRDIVSEADRPLIVELITKNLTQLSRAGAAFRLAEARALYEEGLTMEQIAALFGVTRQRVSLLLREGAKR